MSTCLRLLKEAEELRIEKEKNATEDEKQVTFADEAAVNVVREVISKKFDGNQTENPDSDIIIASSTNADYDDLEEWFENDPNALEDEDEVTTKIDPINPVLFFCDALIVLSQKQQPIFLKLCSNLSQDERNIMGALNNLSNELRNK